MALDGVNRSVIKAIREDFEPCIPCKEHTYASLVQLNFRFLHNRHAKNRPRVVHYSFSLVALVTTTKCSSPTPPSWPLPYLALQPSQCPRATTPCKSSFHLRRATARIRVADVRLVGKLISLPHPDFHRHPVHGPLPVRISSINAADPDTIDTALGGLAVR